MFHVSVRGFRINESEMDSFIKSKKTKNSIFIPNINQEPPPWVTLAKVKPLSSSIDHHYQWCTIIAQPAVVVHPKCVGCVVRISFHRWVSFGNSAAVRWNLFCVWFWPVVVTFPGLSTPVVSSPTMMGMSMSIPVYNIYSLIVQWIRYIPLVFIIL